MRAMHAQAASKAGLIGFTKSCARDLARYKVRANAVLPGFISTPMAHAVPDKVQEMVRRSIPLGRFGEAAEVAKVVRFLASQDASYVTGATVEVTGGLWM